MDLAVCNDRLVGGGRKTSLNLPRSRNKKKMSKLIIGEKTQKSGSVLGKGRGELLGGKKEVLFFFLFKDKNWNKWVNFQRDRLGFHLRPF